MTRIEALNVNTQSGKTAELLTLVKNKMGRVPNMLATLAQSPAALEGYLQFSGALGGARLTAKEREQIALRVAELNSCNYCLSAHSAIGKSLGLTTEQVASSKAGMSASTRENALLALASAIVEKKGKVSDAEIRAARDAGLSDAEVLEVVATVALNIYTNYVNHLADTVVDF